jgi:hypothetical protein
MPIAVSSANETGRMRVRVHLPFSLTEDLSQLSGLLETGGAVISQMFVLSSVLVMIE